MVVAFLSLFFHLLFVMFKAMVLFMFFCLSLTLDCDIVTHFSGVQ